jgi:hypothetical protein
LKNCHITPPDGVVLPYNTLITTKGMMTDTEILKLAKSCGFNPKDAGASLTYWECWERQLLKFAALIYTEGFKVGYDEGWESSNVSTKMNTWSFDDD